MTTQHSFAMVNAPAQTAAAPALPSAMHSLEAIESNFGVLQTAMGRVLKVNVHYGAIPGTGSKDKPAKPTLLKPGADVICALFHLVASYNHQVTDMGNGHREYMSTCTLSDATGRALGQGSGLASTMETKYRFRKAGAECPECGARAIRKSKQEYGGGWYCDSRQEGCGAKFKAGDDKIENQGMGRIEHDNPADYYNTCLKMAAKRAQMAAVLTVTGASAVFTQDLDDMTGNIIDADYSTAPLEPEDMAPPLPPLAELIADLAKECGITDETDIADMERFIKEGAKAQNRNADEIAAAGLVHLDSFKGKFIPWLKKESSARSKKAEAKQPDPAPEASPAAPEDEPWDGQSPPTMPKPKGKPTDDLDAVSGQCWDICNERKLPMDELLSEMFPDVKKEKLTLAQWQQFKGSLG